MKITLLLTALALPLAAFGQAKAPAEPPANAPVPVTTAPAVPGATPGTYVYEQKPITGLPQLITPQQAQTVIEKFKAAYAKLGSPRFLIHVNRDLVDEKTGARLASRNERTETTRTTVDSTIAAANAAQPNNAVTINAGGAVTLSGGAVQGQFPPGPGKVTTTNERQTREDRESTRLNSSH